MAKYNIYIIMSILFLTSVFAGIQSDYPMMGGDRQNTNTGSYNADYDNIPIERFEFFGDLRGNVSDVSGMVAGQIDSSSYPAIVSGHESGLYIYRYDPTIQEMIIAYEDDTVIVQSPVVLYDGDDDGYNEIYFCGVDDGTSAFMAYEIDSGALTQKWSSQVANHSSGTNFSDFGCGFIPKPGTFAGADSYSVIFSPVCGNFDGDNYCIYTGASMTPYDLYRGRANNKPTIYRFDADDGTMSYYDPADPGETYAEVYNPGPHNRIYAYGTQDFSDTIDQMYGDEKLSVPATCDLDDDGDEEYMISLGAYQTSASDYVPVMLLVDIATMTADTSFSSDGVMRIYSDGASYVGSPLCQYNGVEYEAMISVEYAGDNSIFRILDAPNLIDNVDDGLGFLFAPTAYEISQPFIGSYTGVGNQDICVLVDDQPNLKVNLACAKYVGLTGDTLVEELFTYTGSYDLNPSVIATSGGDDLGGDDFSGDFMFGHGIYNMNPDEEEANLMTYGYLGSTGVCGMMDITNDGNADVFCVDDTSTNSNYTFYLTDSANYMMVFNRFIPGIDDVVMCHGNQSYYIEAPTDGYTDVEGDDIRVRVDCTNDGTFDIETNYTVYGSDFEVLCEYNETGTYTAALCMDDINHYDVTTQCGYHTTVVSDALGCTESCYPDCVYDPDDAVIITPEEEEEEDEPTPGVAQMDSNVGMFFEVILGTDIKYRMMAAIAIILGTAYSFMIKTRNETLSIIAGMGTAIMLYLIGLLPGAVVVMLLFVFIVLMFYGRTLVEKVT